MEAFMDQLNQVVVALQGVLSGKILVVLLVGTGIWFTIRLGGVQFREFGHAFKAVFGNIKLNGEKAGKTVVFLPVSGNSDCCSGRYR